MCLQRTPSQFPGPKSGTVTPMPSFGLCRHLYPLGAITPLPLTPSLPPKKTHKRNKSLKERKRLLIVWPVRRDTIISCSPLRLFPWWCPGNRSQHRDLERQPRSHPASQSPPLLDSRQGRAQWHIISHKETKRPSRCKE